MRKLTGISIVSLFITFMICGLFGAVVGAEERLHGDLRNGFTWTYDFETHTLTIDGEGEMPDFTYKELVDAGFKRTMEGEEEEYDTKVIIGDRITSLSNEFVSVINDSGTDIVEIGAGIIDFNRLSGISYRYFANQKYFVSPDNPYYASYEGLVYTKNYEKLVLSPRFQKDYVFHENLKIIGSNAISLVETEDALVIPWGVTTIEESAFDGSGKVVLPETITTVEQPQNTAYWYEYLFPKCKDMICSAFVRDNRSLWMLNYEYHWYDYYGLRPNEWKTINGKRYYFTKSEGWFHSAPHSYEVEPHMVTGWWKIDGTAYYFDETGAMAQDCWKEIDGKWTRFDEDGGVKKGFWISIAAWFRGLWG